jgi:hypothetical protein
MCGFDINLLIEETTESLAFKNANILYQYPARVEILTLYWYQGFLLFPPGYLPMCGFDIN